MASTKKIKDFYSTKSNKEKIYKALNFSASISGYSELKDKFAIGLGKKFVSFDNSIISECYGNEDVIFDNKNNNFVLINNDLKQRLGTAQGRDEVFHILNEDMDIGIEKKYFIEELNNKYNKLNLGEKTSILTINFDNNFIDTVVNIMDENDDSFHSYPSFKLNESGKLDISFQTKIYSYDKLLDIDNCESKRYEIYLPFEFGKQYKKISNLHYNLYRNNERSNIAEVKLEFDKFSYRLLYLVLKER